MTTRLERGRQAFANREWQKAYRHLSAAEADLPLDPEDLECLAQAAWLSGRDTDAQALFRRAHHVLIDRGQRHRAARWGFWLSLHALLAGDSAQSTGWLARMQRLVADEPQGAEQGYVGVISGLRRMAQADAEGARTSFELAIALAERFADRDLLALGLLGRGQALIRSKRVAEGVAQLDEAMVGVTAGEISPMAAGIVYCAVIVTCQRIFDLQRCREWTQALTDWCATQTDLVPFRGECLIHRSEILQLQGEWPDAIVEAERAIEVCSGRAGNLAGRALYQCAELHRLRGAFERAEADGRLALNVPGPTPPLFAVMADALGRHVDPRAASFVHFVFSLHDERELRELVSAAGFQDVRVETRNATLAVPPSNRFLWQYVFSTPLSTLVVQASEETRVALEREIVEKWRDFEVDETLRFEVPVTTVVAR